jgi:hypothetical protein
MVRVTIVSLLAIALMVSCFSLQRENLSEDPTPYKKTIRSNYDNAWERAISFFALYEIDVQRAIKKDGLISSYDASLLDRSEYAQRVWPAWCTGRSLGKMDFYIKIKPRNDSDSIDVSITAVFYSLFAGRCISTGEFEKSFVEYLSENK